SFNGGASQSSYDSKNSYRLKLSEKASLLGMGSSNKDWVLNSNKFDAVGLRCFATWQLASYMDTLPFVTECAWVNMYINGEYRGMYMVTELIEVAQDRVEVEDNVNGTDKGFLIELDFRGNWDNGQLGLDYFYVEGYGSPSDGRDNPIEFVIKSNVDSEDDTAAIESYVVLCHKALMSGNRATIDKYVDIPSLIDMFILEELSKDVDVGAASFFIQKDIGGKLYFTAPWDFDFGYGTYGPAVSYTGFYSESGSSCEWFKALMKHNWFRQEVLARMVELDDDFTQVIADVKAKGADLYIAGDRNATFWNMYGNHFHGYVSGSVSSDLRSYQEHIDFLTAWMEVRWDWMKNNL
ncbi:MAG: CotH kinase family protein, partial [Clostridia bacterium]|nr:CotH kinase family protein [Clostridia bacterium]